MIFVDAFSGSEEFFSVLEGNNDMHTGIGCSVPVVEVDVAGVSGEVLNEKMAFWFPRQIFSESKGR